MRVVVKDRICRQCGSSFMGGPRAWYCQDCRAERRLMQAAERRKKPGPDRPIGSVDQCAVCGQDYIVMSGNQKYCKDCADDAVKAKDRQASLEYYRDNRADVSDKKRARREAREKVCVVCGETFNPHGKPEKMCSPECREKRRKQWQRDAEAKRDQRKRGVGIG